MAFVTHTLFPRLSTCYAMLWPEVWRDIAYNRLSGVDAVIVNSILFPGWGERGVLGPRSFPFEL